MLIKPDIARFARIKVVGVGGGGGNAINTMVLGGQIKGVDFIAANTDAQALLNSQASVKIQIGDLNLSRWWRRFHRSPFHASSLSASINVLAI